jgi:hypothetical protein
VNALAPLGSLPQVFYDMPASIYHTDADGPRLSQSLVTICCNQSPLHAWQAHPLLGGKPYTYEPSDDDGSIIHALMLEPDNAALIHAMTSVYDKKHERAGQVVSDFKTKAAQEERDAALARGQIPMPPEKLAVYRYKAKALRSRLEDMGTTFDGRSEVVIYWTEETPFGPVRCRCRIDHLFLGERALIIDLKSTKDAHPHALKRAIWEYGYDIQHAGYTRAVAAAFPDYAGRIDMPFAFGELDKPYAVNPIRLDGEFQRLGEARWERGRNRWAKCLYEDRWTAYDGGTIDPPAYALAQEMGEA